MVPAVFVAFVAAGLVLLATGHVEAQVDSGRSDVRENLTGPTGTSEAASAPGLGVRFGAPEKVATVIQEAVASIDRQRRATSAESLAALSTDLVRVTPAGEIHVYVLLTDGRPEYVA